MRTSRIPEFPLLQALPLIREVGRHALSLQSGIKRETKESVHGGPEVVTVADREVQARFFAGLAERGLDWPTVGEESKEHRIPHGKFVTFDPIDGTIPYANGTADWGNLLGVFIDGRPHSGILNRPPTGKTYLFDGTTQRIELIGADESRTVLERPSRIEPVLAYGEIYHPGDAAKVREIATKLGLRYQAVESAAVTTEGLLLGHFAIFIGPGAKIWDVSPIAAALPLLGGCGVRGIDGAEMSWRSAICGGIWGWDQSLIAALSAEIAPLKFKRPGQG